MKEEINLEEEFNKLDENSPLRKFQEYTEKMIKVRGFDNETPEDVVLLLTEELGEVAKEVRKSTSIKMDVNSSKEQNLDKEIADLFNMLMSLCVVTKVDLFNAFKNKEEINLKRKWN